jgi:hypothetical protein
MKLKILQLNNYKSFFDSSQLSLEPGFNLVVGANNVGKTALLEAMSLNFASHPHRSILTIPWPGAQPAPNSTVQATFQLDPGEAKDLLIDATEFFTIPSPTEPNDINQAHRWLNGFDSSDLLVVGLKGEGYLLRPSAIAALVETIPEIHTERVMDLAAIEKWLLENRILPQYYPKQTSEAERSEETWRTKVDGARLLIDLFSALSDKRVQYDKKAYGLVLTQWLIENEPGELEEVTELLKLKLNTEASE